MPRTRVRTERCPDCKGKGYGYMEYAVYDARQGQYYPNEKLYECFRCKGTGSISIYRCDDCGNDTRACTCIPSIDPARHNQVRKGEP